MTGERKNFAQSNDPSLSNVSDSKLSLERTQAIQELNDRLRKEGRGGILQMTNGVATMIRWREKRIRNSGLKRAIAAHDTAYFYGWLMEMFSYQGISDTVAADYIERYGNADWTNVAHAIETTSQRCGKLEAFETYKDCGFRKSSHSCANPGLIDSCPVPGCHSARATSIS